MIPANIFLNLDDDQVRRLITAVSRLMETEKTHNDEQHRRDRDLLQTLIQRRGDARKQIIEHPSS